MNMLQLPIPLPRQFPFRQFPCLSRGCVRNPFRTVAIALVLAAGGSVAAGPSPGSSPAATSVVVSTAAGAGVEHESIPREAGGEVVAAAEGGQSFEFSRLAMGTRVRIVLVALDEDDAAAIAAEAFELLESLEQSMSDWRETSDVTSLANSAGGDFIEVPEPLHRVLRLARRVAELTDGAFDPTVGPLVRLWRDARSEGTPPSDDAIDAAVELVDWRDLQLRAPQRVRLKREGMRLDLGGIGKGFALDEMATLLRNRGVVSFLLDFGSTVLAVGGRPDGEDWRVGRAGGDSLRLRDMAVAFSGDDEQYMIVDGVRLGHIVDPASGAAKAGPMRVMVVAREAAFADALSTATSVLGVEAAIDLIDRLDDCALSFEFLTSIGGERLWRAVETPGLAELARGDQRGQPAIPALRRTRRDSVIALEVAEIVFERAEGVGVPVTLLGVAHIGDRDAYRRFQRLLDDHSGPQRSDEEPQINAGLVLFESVLPDGARPPSGSDPDERTASTRATMQLLAAEFGRLLGDDRGALADAEIDRAIDLAVRRQPRNGPLLRPLHRDAWGAPFLIESTPAERAADPGEVLDDAAIDHAIAAAAMDRYWLVSLGADGAEGGDGEATDIRVEIVPSTERDDGGLQAEMARVLGLAYQLDAMNYDRVRWRAADMTLAELAESAREFGADLDPLIGGITGGSLPATVLRMLVRFVQLADGFAGNVIRDTMRAMMIELLAEPDVMQMADAQMGAMMRVILDERNRVAIEVMEDALAEAPAPRSIAIFYGAAHLPDLGVRLMELGYRPTRIEWHPMMTLDLAASRVDERQLAQLRQMVRRMTGAR